MRKLLSTLFLSLAATCWAAPDALVVGQVAPFSGADAEQANAWAAGMKLHFDAVNRAGGIHGRMVRLVEVNDYGHAPSTVQGVRELLGHEQPIAIAGVFGTANIAAITQSGLLRKTGVPLVGYRTAGIVEAQPLVYNVRMGAQDEVTSLVRTLADSGMQRIGLFVENGPRAPELVALAEAAARSANARIVAHAFHDPATGQANAASQLIAHEQPQVIVLAGSALANAAFVERYRQMGGKAALHSTSSVDSGQLAKWLGPDDAESLCVTQVTPNPLDRTTALTREFGDRVTAAGSRGVTVSHAMLEGYIAAKVITDAATRMGPVVSHPRFLAALRATDMDLGGYAVRFARGERVVRSDARPGV
jgi:branched-chain amino acid transport system substrate-binding protein